MNNEDIVISHIFYRDGEWHIQTNKEHCDGIAELAASFAKEFGYEDWGYLLGQLHDRGKERRGFQQYIRRKSGYDKNASSSDSHHHSRIGALIADRSGLDEYHLLANDIAGHHRGLYDYQELESKLTGDIPADVDTTLPVCKLNKPTVNILKKHYSHIVRMVFSSLADADWLDTERFMSPSKYKMRGNDKGMSYFQGCLNVHLNELSQKEATPLNVLRREIQEYCKKSAGMMPGFFELTVPTGGGKTIASMVWAIEHALIHGKKRIVIAIPYTSIIAQTASNLKHIFGVENVLEHHSAISESEDDKPKERHKSKSDDSSEPDDFDVAQLATENWDAPIIVTTNVQLFESMFSNKPGVCRKLHSLCNSVVILDEVQCLPVTLLQPIVDAMKCYVSVFGTSFLFCTASQPVLDGCWIGRSDSSFKGIDRQAIREIVPKEMELHKRMQRVKLEIDLNTTDVAVIAEWISQEPKALCIVNTKKSANAIYSLLLSDMGNKYHLSKQMCQAHILEKINEIKNKLKEGENVTVVSTQLIEAGVDIDFPVVFRELSGLDSILQAAGRCNREGKLDKGITHVFSLNDINVSPTIRDGCYAMQDLLALMEDPDWFSPEVMREYYDAYYSRVPSYDKPDIAGKLNDPNKCKYETAAKAFKMIEETGVDLIVNYGDSASLIAEVKESGFSKDLSRKLGRYTVSVPKKTFNDFRERGLIEEVAPQVYYVPSADQYDLHTGLKTNNEYLEQLL